jgi:hypothetical protein
VKPSSRPSRCRMRVMWFLLGLVADTRLVSLAAPPLPTPHMGVFRPPSSADSSRMEPALSSTPAGVPETHHVLREGALVAVLRLRADGGTFSVAAELSEEERGENAIRLRQYTFAHLDEASAFLVEVASSFAFLGCELRRA